ncbi:MAG: Crp/Fnr family transcriptional regulator [Burkholderiales bacterium]|nr:Crp/Fnr family transcriptional regulator [Burkholderiales bacterium]
MLACPFDIPRYLSLLPLFAQMPQAKLDHIAAHSQVRRVSRGTLVFEAGQRCTALHITVTGQVKLCVLSASGQEKVIELAGPGISLAEETVFTDAAYRVNAQALSDCTLLTIAKPALLGAIAQDASLALRMLASAGQRLQTLLHDVEAEALHTGLQRVVRFLLHSANEARADAAGPDLTVDLPASKATIASRLSLTPEYFSRVLHELQSQGLIGIDRRAIRIHDAQRLQRYPVAA